MLRITDIQSQLIQSEGGLFQKICNEILSFQGYKTHKLTGSVLGTNKTRLGTPDSVYIDGDGKYVYVEITTKQGDLSDKIIDDINKCLKKISDNPVLNGLVSKIIFMHNQNNIDETLYEQAKKICGNIELEVYGIDNISVILQKDFPNIAISELNVKDDTSMIEGFSENALNQLAEKLSKSKSSEFESSTVDEIKKKINGYYEKAIKIINTNDAMISISDDNKEILKTIFDGLTALDFYYKDKDNDDSKLYYHNMLVIKSKYDCKTGIDYYNSIPKFAQENNLTLHFYSMLLIENNRLDDAEKILKDLYYTKKYEDSFETLMRVYFLLEKYDEIVKILSPQKTEKYDKYGFLASILIVSKNTIKRYSESEILKLNNSRFNKMPVFYSCTAKMLFDLGKKNNKYKEQFKKAIKYLNEDDTIVIFTICNQAIEIGLEDIAISYLESIELTPVLQEKYLELLCLKEIITENHIDFLSKIDMNMYKNKIDTDFLNAKIEESKGHELNSIKLYEKSFINNCNVRAWYKYIQLSIKNKADINEKIVNAMQESNNVNVLMMKAEAYRYNGKYDESLKYSYKAIYNSNNTSRFSDAYRQFWTIMMMHSKEDEPCKVLKNTVVVLNNDGKNLIYLIEDDPYFEENKKILDATIIRSTSDMGLAVLHKNKDDIVEIANSKYSVLEILNKYSYFARSSFKYVRENKYIKVLTSRSDNPEESVEQIKNQMIDINKSVNERLNLYQESKNLPLSGLLSNDNNFDEYARLINTLLGDKDRILLSGETIDIDLSNGFVVDISTLIVLSIMNFIDVIPKSFCSNIYITESLKNKFKYFYKTLSFKQEDKESNLYLTEDSKLILNEIMVLDQIKYWKKLNEYIDLFTVVNIEACKDSLYNENTNSFLDKTQFDLIELSKMKDLPFISDDLAIRRICNYYKVNHTNVIQILKYFSSDEKDFINKFVILSKHNYIYTLYSDTLSFVIKELYTDFNEDNKDNFILIVNSILENKVAFDYYIPILKFRIEKLKSVQFIKVFDHVYENIVISFIIDNVINIIKNRCEVLGLDYSKYI